MRVDSYDVAMEFDPPKRRFRGTVDIALETDRDGVVLNAVDLAIGAVTVDGRPAESRSDAGTQELTIPGVAPGPHRVAIAFDGEVLPAGLAGMYVSPFGKGGEILTTQMYPAGTRRFFPCVDAPAAKAEMRVEVTVPKAAHVVFNTDPVASTEEGDRKRIRFAPTPRMSTYLLYLGIGPFEETQRVDGALRTVVAHPPGRAASAQFALDHAARFVREYEAYYDIPYPLPKLHLVAVPSFWAGAMENWGAIAFRETALLVDASTDAFARRWNRLVLCHEIAHQWFGNLVTNAWWSDFWLNEAFATFVASRIVDRVHPGESTWGEFLLRESGRGFSEDVLDTAHPIAVEIRGPDEIGEIADGITYGKGASVLRMIESYLGEASFRKGVTAYLNAHRYGAAGSDDLWTALDANSGAPVSRIMKEWITRPGHPLVELRRDGDELVVTQRRFHADGRRDDATWPVPLVLETAGTECRALLEAAPLRVPCPRGAPWRANPERTGFFHLRYDGPLFDELLGGWERLSELDQWGLLVDAGFLLTSGDLPLPGYLRLVDAARTSPRYLPSIVTARSLRGFLPFLATTPPLEAAFRSFYVDQFARLGPARRPGEAETVGVLRNALGWGLLDADPSARHELAHRFAKDPASVDRDLRDVATVAYVRDGGRGAWEDLRERIPTAPSDEEAARLATALPRAPGAAEFRETLTLLDGPSLSASRIWDVLRAANGVPAHHAALWAWYAERLPALSERWKGTPLLSMLLPEALPWVGLERAPEVRAYFAAHRFPGAERGLAEGLERLRIREILRDRLRAAA